MAPPYIYILNVSFLIMSESDHINGNKKVQQGEPKC